MEKIDKKSFKEKAEKLYSELKQDLENRADWNKQCIFTLQCGDDFDEGILFVGKAVNGWGNDVSFENMNKHLKQVEDRTLGKDDVYNVNDSAFWRVARSVAGKQYGEQWHNKVAWTNLYKIAPQNGGNPNGGLQNAQFEKCVEILKTEIEFLKPKYVVMMTSGWEDDFIEKLGKPEEIGCEKWGDENETKCIEINDVRYILAPHPARKKGGEEIQKEAILKFIKSHLKK